MRGLHVVIIFLGCSMLGTDPHMWPRKRTELVTVPVLPLGGILRGGAAPAATAAAAAASASLRSSQSLSCTGWVTRVYC